jgi:serine/threonine protein kinase
MPQSSLQIGPQTTATDLRLLIAQDPGGAVKLRGTVDPQTKVITLHASSRSPDLKAKITGEAKNASAIGRQGVRKVFDQTQLKISQNACGHLTQEDRRDIDSMFKAVNSRVDGNASRSLKGSGVLLLAKSMEGALQYTEQLRDEAKDRAAAAKPKLADAGDLASVINDSAGKLAARLQVDGNTGPIAEALGDALAARFKLNNVSESARRDFAFSTGDEFKSQLSEALKAGLEERGGSGSVDAKTLQLFVDAVFNEAASQMLPDRTLPDTAQDNNPQVPSIMVGKVRYDPCAVLGKGNMGTVYEYKSSTGDKLAYKLAKPNVPLNYVLNEAKLHQAACGEGHGNVLAYRGATRSADGTVGIITDIAEGGDGKAAAGRIAQAVADQTITQDQANVLRMTLFRDMVAGLLHVNDAQGVIHSDIKLENFLIDSKGNLKIADLGVAMEGTVRHQDSFLGYTPLYASPEHTRNVFEATKKADDAMIASGMEKLLSEAFPGTSAADLKCLTRSAVLPRIKEANDAKLLSNKVDSFALGEAALFLFKGREIHLSPFDKLSYKTALAKPDTNGVIPHTALASTTGLDAADDLINALLAPQPDRRPDMVDALLRDTFDLPGVGSSHARDLLVALKSGDQNGIAQAKAALDLGVLEQRLAVE